MGVCMKQIRAGVLEIAYEDIGPTDGASVILLHGFPMTYAPTMPSQPCWRRRGCAA